jgi:transaldolase
MVESYFLAVKERTPSRLWVNNPTVGEVHLAFEQGAVGCTTNPGYGGNLLRRAPEEVLPIIRECAAETGDAVTAAHLVQLRLVSRIAARYAPLFRESGGRDGYVSIQGAPDEDHDGPRILAQGLEARSIGPNIAVKIPATGPGFFAFERLVADGTPTIVTEVFSLAQLIEACTIYLRVTAATGQRPRFFMSPITGILSDHLKAVAAAECIPCSVAVLDWAGVALARACNQVVESRDYPVTLLFGGARLPVDFTGLVGARTAATINYSTVAEILESPSSIEDSIHAPVDPRVLAELTAKFEDFALAMSLDGLPVDEFEEFGPVLHFRSSFLAGWRAVVDACATEIARSGLAGAAGAA